MHEIVQQKSSTECRNLTEDREEVWPVDVCEAQFLKVTWQIVARAVGAAFTQLLKAFLVEVAPFLPFAGDARQGSAERHVWLFRLVDAVCCEMLAGIDFEGFLMGAMPAAQALPWTEVACGFLRILAHAPTRRTQSGEGSMSPRLGA